MKTSVVLATYNGIRHIKPLLESLVSQSEIIDEVIVCDDCSSDNTFEFVSEFVKNKKLERWAVCRNETNIGFKANFLKGLSMATGEIIFPCDQDDVWHPDKVKIFKTVMSINERIQVLFCGSVSFCGDGGYAFKSFGDENEIVGLKQIDFAVEVKNCYGAGHLLCLRRDLVRQWSSVLQDFEMTFDIPFCLLASSFGGLYRIDNILVARRFHKNNTSGATKYKIDAVRSRNRIIQGRDSRLGYFEFLIGFSDRIGLDDKFYEFVNILKKSREGIENKNVRPLLIELFSKNKYINKVLTLIGVGGCFMR